MINRWEDPKKEKLTTSKEDIEEEDTKETTMVEILKI
ncbi:hypothetical protein Tco_0518421, partial [Tanacetum coccineum]